MAFDTMKKRFKITSDNTKVSATLSNFDAIYDLANAPAAFWDSVKSDGGDIRVVASDESTELAIDMVVIDTVGKTGYIAFNTSTLFGSIDTDYWIYFDDALASLYAPGDPFGAYASYDGNYFLVSHLKAVSDGSIGEFGDVSGTGNDGTGVSPFPASVTGKVGKAAEYDASADRIDFGTDPSTRPTDNLTVSTWVKFANIVSVDVALDIRLNNENEGYVVLTGFPGSQRLNFLVHTISGWNVQMQGNAPLSSDTWYKFDATFTSGRQRLYINGIEQSAVSTVFGSIGYDASQSLKAGGGHNTVVNNRMVGSQDELKCSNSVRPGDWILTEYNNQNDPSTFWSQGAVEDVTDGVVDNALLFGHNF